MCCHTAGLSGNAYLAKRNYDLLPSCSLFSKIMCIKSVSLMRCYFFSDSLFWEERKRDSIFSYKKKTQKLHLQLRGLLPIKELKFWPKSFQQLFVFVWHPTVLARCKNVWKYHFINVCLATEPCHCKLRLDKMTPYQLSTCIIHGMTCNSGFHGKVVS